MRYLNPITGYDNALDDINVGFNFLLSTEVV
jgi:hypothetical protein